MAEQIEVKELDQVVVRFSGDSGDGMQLAGTIFTTVSATVGNGISTFPDYPADIRAPQGSLTGVSGFQVHIGGEKVLDDYLGELGIDPDCVVDCPITTMVKECLKDSGMDNKSILKCRNMFALGIVCWLFNRDRKLIANFLEKKFAKKPHLAVNNIKATTMPATPMPPYRPPTASRVSTRRRAATWTSPATRPRPTA